MENDSILTDDMDIAKVTNNLSLKPYKDSSITNINGTTSKFDNHISIKKIKESFRSIACGHFNFEEVAREDVKKRNNKFECKKILN